MKKNQSVSVFESADTEEIQIVKSKLEKAGISTKIEENISSLSEITDGIILSLVVDLSDEVRAFDVIDSYLQKTDS